jgi:hypothetical protein
VEPHRFVRRRGFSCFIHNRLTRGGEVAKHCKISSLRENRGHEYTHQAGFEPTISVLELSNWFLFTDHDRKRKICTDLGFSATNWVLSSLERKVNKIHTFVTMAYQYNYHNSGHYPSSCPLFNTELTNKRLSVPNKKHIMSPLRAQQVNAIYRFMTMAY